MRLLIVVIVSLCVVGCGNGRVRVVDPQNVPIRGARVAPVSLSISGGPKTTNARGEASIPLNIGQDTKWIDVSKPGFQSVQVDIPSKWPLTVILQRATQP
jgi:hypothetical protein